MSETGAYLLGDVDWPQPKERMAAILRRSGLSVTVGSYALTVDDCSSFRFQEYGGDLGDPQIEAGAGSVEKMVADARLVSGALAQADVAHCFEVHDGDDRVVAMLEHTADPAAPAEGADRSAVERTMRIAFDLDGTLVPGGRRLEPGMERALVLTGWWFRERLRKARRSSCATSTGKGMRSGSTRRRYGRPGIYGGGSGFRGFRSAAWSTRSGTSGRWPVCQAARRRSIRRASGSTSWSTTPRESRRRGASTAFEWSRLILATRLGRPGYAMRSSVAVSCLGNPRPGVLRQTPRRGHGTTSTASRVPSPGTSRRLCHQQDYLLM